MKISRLLFEKEETPAEIEESIQYRKSVRNGKVVRVPFTTSPGKKIKRVKGRPVEVRMTPAEIRRRSKASIKAQRKLKSKSKQIARKRARSLRKHTW